MDKPICLFDSGIGGLTVLKKLLSKFPNEKYIYFADLARVPFGDRTKDDIQNIANEIISWLHRYNPKAIIMACNTSSSVLCEQGRISPAPTVPIYGMIKSCAKEIGKSNYTKVTVWATKLVVESNAYKKEIQKINPNLIVEEIACPKLVPMIEDLNFNSQNKKKLISQYLEKTSKDSQALILGCTHYPLLREDIKNLLNIDIIDPTDSLLKDSGKTFTSSEDLLQQVSTNQINLYATAQAEKLERFAKLYLCGDYMVNLVSLAKTTVA